MHPIPSHGSPLFGRQSPSLLHSSTQIAPTPPLDDGPSLAAEPYPDCLEKGRLDVEGRPAPLIHIPPRLKRSPTGASLVSLPANHGIETHFSGGSDEDAGDVSNHEARCCCDPPGSGGRCSPPQRHHLASVDVRSGRQVSPPPESERAGGPWPDPPQSTATFAPRAVSHAIQQMRIVLNAWIAPRQATADARRRAHGATTTPLTQRDAHSMPPSMSNRPPRPRGA